MRYVKWLKKDEEVGPVAQCVYYVFSLLLIFLISLIFLVTFPLWFVPVAIYLRKNKRKETEECEVIYYEYS